mmetsp:Transcript_12559/g.39318  ORF Transcript_12559/g.39318 Transcript_12559/m.39318 type:complete len:319 (-) Transcript_12559:1508-2464(-)
MSSGPVLAHSMQRQRPSDAWKRCRASGAQCALWPGSGRGLAVKRSLMKTVAASGCRAARSWTCPRSPLRRGRRCEPGGGQAPPSPMPRSRGSPRRARARPRPSTSTGSSTARRARTRSSPRCRARSSRRWRERPSASSPTAPAAAARLTRWRTWQTARRRSSSGTRPAWPGRACAWRRRCRRWRSRTSSCATSCGRTMAVQECRGCGRWAWAVPRCSRVPARSRSAAGPARGCPRASVRPCAPRRRSALQPQPRRTEGRRAPTSWQRSCSPATTWPRALSARAASSASWTLPPATGRAGLASWASCSTSAAHSTRLLT